MILRLGVLGHITTFSPGSGGDLLCRYRNALTVAVSVSAVWPAANRAIHVPIWLPTTELIVKLWAMNGAVVSGNIDVGLFAEDGTLIKAAGSTVQAGTNTLQEFDITDTLVGPGWFYLSAALDNATGTIFAVTSGSVVENQLAGLAQQATAFPLANATLATVGSAYCPVLGATTRTVM